MRERKVVVNAGFYDTNILIAYLFGEEKRVEKAGEVIRKHLVKALSIISVHELYWYSIKYGVENRFKQIKNLIEKIFRVEPLSQEVCLEAGGLRRKYGIPEIDSLILATAIINNYPYFYSFDRDFEVLSNKRIKNTIVYYLEGM